MTSNAEELDHFDLVPALSSSRFVWDRLVDFSFCSVPAPQH